MYTNSNDIMNAKLDMKKGLLFDAALRKGLVVGLTAPAFLFTDYSAPVIRITGQGVPLYRKSKATGMFGKNSKGYWVIAKQDFNKIGSDFRKSLVQL